MSDPRKDVVGRIEFEIVRKPSDDEKLRDLIDIVKQLKRLVEQQTEEIRKLRQSPPKK